MFLVLLAIVINFQNPLSDRLFKGSEFKIDLSDKGLIGALSALGLLGFIGIIFVVIFGFLCTI